MSKLLKFPFYICRPLFEAQSNNTASLNIASTRFKSKQQCSSQKENKKEQKQCGPVKSSKGKDKKEECSSDKGEKGDKTHGPSKGGKGGKEKATCGSMDGDHDKHESYDSKDEECSEGRTISDFPRIGINGFGRIGRMVMRIAAEYSCPLEIVAVNDPMTKPEMMAYLLKYDSSHGRFVTDVELDEGKLVIDGKKVCTYQENEPKNIPWKDLGVDYVIESSGKYLTAEKSQGHLDAGAKHVIVSAPCKDNCPTFVVGVNLDEYETSMKVVSAASCATNALAPMAKVIYDNFGIVEGFMTTVHAVTASQRVLDQASKKNWRESRGCMQNMIPTFTGAAVAVAKVLPELKGKMTALSVRVPIPNVSMIDFSVRTEKPTCLEEILKVMEEASDDSMLGIINVTKDDVVSSDFLGSHYSCIYDSKASMELNKNFFKLIAWFDNEYGYTCRVIDLIKFMHAEAKEEKEAKEAKEKDC